MLNIERTIVGGGALDEPTIDADLPLLSGIRVNNAPLAGFSPTVFDYIVTLPPTATEVPDVRPHGTGHVVDVLPASHPNGKTVLIVRSRRDPTKSVRYNVRFVTTP